MDTKHTPGPWTKVKRKVTPSLMDYSIVAEGEGFWDLATVHDDGGSRAIANAILIAAAPDLLAALGDLLVIATDHLRYSGDEVSNARAAIARAKGGQ
jgi:hypothetical protein